MKPLRILHTDFHRGWGGQASRILMLGKELSRRGHEVVIAAPRGELSRRAREAGLSVEDRFAFRAPAHAVSFLADVRRLAVMLGRERFDVVDVHGSQDTWVAAIARAATRKPDCLVMTRHNTKRVRTGLPNRLLYGRMIDHLIIVDESIRRQYLPLLTGGVLADGRISVVPSAYRTDLFHKGVDGSAVRRELNLAEDAIAIGVAGRLVTDKGHTFLFQAVQRLLPRYPKIVIVLAGAGPHEQALRDEAAARGLADRLRFLGFRSDIAQVQAAFDIAVLPSIDCDASSASLKEAMALGVPVIASDIGGARFIIEDGVTGLVVEPGSGEALAAGLDRLLADLAGREAMARRAQLLVASRFSVERLADGTLQAYALALTSVAGDRVAGARVEAGRVA